MYLPCSPQTMACVILSCFSFNNNNENFRLIPENTKELFGLGLPPVFLGRFIVIQMAENMLFGSRLQGSLVCSEVKHLLIFAS